MASGASKVTGKLGESEDLKAPGAGAGAASHDSLPITLFLLKLGKFVIVPL